MDDGHYVPRIGGNSAQEGGRGSPYWLTPLTQVSANCTRDNTSVLMMAPVLLNTWKKILAKWLQVYSKKKMTAGAVILREFNG